MQWITSGDAGNAATICPVGEVTRIDSGVSSIQLVRGVRVGGGTETLIAEAHVEATQQ